MVYKKDIKFFQWIFPVMFTNIYMIALSSILGYSNKVLGTSMILGGLTGFSRMIYQNKKIGKLKNFPKVRLKR